MSKRSIFLTAAALGLLACLGGVGPANAGTITQTFTNPSTTVPYNVTFAANSFNHYEPSSATLTSVEILVTSLITGKVQVINISPSAQTFSNATGSVPVSITGPNSLGLSVTATTPGQSGNIAAAPAGGFTEETLSGSTVTASVGTTLTGSAVDPYLGTGTNDLSFVFTAGAGTFGGSSSANGFVFFGGSATASATVQLVYNFTTAAIPEPNSMSLLGIGMAGFFAFRRYFNKRNADV
jgi:hypothetical protein